MLLGTTKRNISPPKKLRLSGYSTREANFNDVLEDIFLRIYYFKDKEINNDIIFIYGDIIWWGTDYINEIKKDLVQFNIPLDRFIFIASHNHSGPPTSNNFTQTLETYDKEYARFLKKNIVDGIMAAKENLEPVYAKLYKGTSNLNVYRRVTTRDGIEMMPNYDVKADNDLTTIAFYRNNSSMKGVLIHYPCHANVSNENMIQPDYPGVTLRMLDEEFDNSISMYLPGATGDLRPNIVLGNSFVAGDYNAVLKFADYFYEDIMNTLKSNSQAICFKLDVSTHKIMLPLENLKQTDEVEKLLESNMTLEREWAKKVLEKIIEVTKC